MKWKRLWNLALGLTFTTVVNLPGAEAANQPTPNRLNVLFIAVDDLRPEMGCYGNKVVRTPNLDRLAARGMVFTHAYCQQAVCSPSRSSLMTGRRPDATQVWDLVTHFRVALPDAVTLPQHFKAHGYYCAALSKIYHHGFEDGRSWSEPHWYPNGQTIDTDPVDWTKRIVQRTGAGVQEYLKQPMPADNDNPGAGRKAGKPPKGAAFEISPKSDDELPDGNTAAEAVKRIHDLKAKGQPFFLAVGFLKPHLPFVAPKRYWELYDPEKIPLPAIDHLPDGAPAFAGHDNGELHSYANIPKGDPIPADLAKTLRHGYYACVSYMDAQVGRLLDALEREGLADNTVVALWGDHGWQLGDHGLWHKHTNFELATRAPLLISLPRQMAAGQKCDAVVEFLDIYPTLADVCGLPIPAGLDGVSLKPLLDHPSAPWTKVALSQYPRGGKQTDNRPLMGYSVRGERWRLTVWRDRKNQEAVATELYDEKNDPAETVNLATRPENKVVIESLSKHLPAQAAPVPAPKAGAAARAPRRAVNREALFERKDANGDNKLTREEFMKRPNILLIVSDDQGYADTGFQGCKDIPTPNLDRLAKSGLRCTSGYVTHPFCSPTRAALMAGRYQQRFGHEFNPVYDPLDPEEGLPLTEKLLPAFLKDAGYITGWIGKWHLGASPAHTPQRRGFDETFGFIGGGHQYWNWKPNERQYTLAIERNGHPVEVTNHLTTAFGDEAAAFVKRHPQGLWFLYLAFNAPHTPHQPTPARLARFADIQPPKRAQYAAQVSLMDDAIGVTLNALKQSGQEARTLVFFFSDNGGAEVNASDNTPLRGWKGQVYEGGMRVPFVVSWPGRLPAGKDYAQPVSSLDVFATALACAGLPMPTDRKYDGVNIVPYLAGEKQGAPHERLFWRVGENQRWGLREGDWKLVRLKDKPDELYNLADDIGEKHNLVDAQPDVARRLAAALDAWNKELVPPAFLGSSVKNEDWGPGGVNQKNRPQQKPRQGGAAAPRQSTVP